MQQTLQRFRRLCMLAVLASAFSLPAFADEIPCGIAPPPPPSAASNETSEETGETGDVTDLLAALLNGLLTVL